MPLLPLSFAQQRLWFLDQLLSGNSPYNVPTAVRLSGLLDVRCLEQSINAVIIRHEVLRTTIKSVQGKPVQIVADDCFLPLAIHDLSMQPEADKESEASQVLAVEAQRPFDLTQDLMLRATLIKLSEQEHLLLLVMHHIASDGWSMAILMRELSDFYEAEITGRPSSLPELPIQYADYAEWQLEGFQGKVLNEELDYWKQQLAGAPTRLNLPTDRPRPAVQTFRGASRQLELSSELTQSLKELSVREKASLFMTLLAAFQVLLYRWTAQDDIVLGSPIAGRNRGDVKDLIGFFVNTLALRTDLSGDPTFLELLRRVRKVALEAYDHQDLPFERLLEELQPERSLSHNPLFQVMFILQNDPGSPLRLSGLESSPMPLATETTHFDLTMSITEQPLGLIARLSYSTDLFEEPTIERMLGHFEVLLDAIAMDASQTLSALPILTEAERRQLLVEWNDTAAAYPRERCVHELFEEQVLRTPDAVAVVCEDRQLTYHELNQQANQLAHYLRSLGVGPETLVGLCLERSPELVVAVLGILKAGGAYVPLDPTYPSKRLSFMVQDCHAALILTHSRFLDQLGEAQTRVVCVDECKRAISEESNKNLAIEMTPDQPLYVLYTSGSTGTPKGVVGLHRATVNRITWMWRTYPFAPDDVSCLKTTFSFVDSVWEMFGGLLCGVRTIIIPDPTVKDPVALTNTLATHGVTRIVLVPSLLRVLLENWGDLRGKVPRLRIFISSGEALSLELSQRFRRMLPDARLINLYGSSEVAADVTCCDTTEDVLLTYVPIGRPIANTQVYVLDAHRQPVPISVPGELYVGGAGVARGYLNRPELTAERFVGNPFDDDPDSRLFRTGDLCRWRADGNLEFLGRLDGQVKLRGFRIELGEIESVLDEHTDVAQSVVMLREDRPGDKRLAAYCVPSTAIACEPEKLRKFLGQRLPDYMVPSAYVFLQTFPLTPSGKVDRRALPSISAADRRSADFIEPRDNIERKLTKIWEELLGVKLIGMKDNFFDLGGHSLLATQLIARIEKTLGSVSLSSLFQSPTIESLARELRQKKKADKDSSLVLFRSGGSRPPLFVHGGSFELSRHLGDDQPCYGIRPHGQDGRKAPATVEEMAADYLRQIRGVQPQGPYLIGGFSFGGLVAWEMAQQLRESGQEVALLVLIDPSPPYSSTSQPPSNDSRRNSTLNRHLTALRQADPRPLVAALRSRGQRMVNALKRRVCVAYLKFGHRIPSSLRLFYFFEMSEEATRKYLPRPYPGRTVLLSAQPDTVGLWRSLVVGSLEVHHLQGHHLDAIKGPRVELWAKQLKSSLSNAL